VEPNERPDIDENHPIEELNVVVATFGKPRAVRVVPAATAASWQWKNGRLSDLASFQRPRSRADGHGRSRKLAPICPIRKPMNINRMSFLVSLILAANAWAGAPRVFNPSAGLTFRLHDTLEHPFVWWPRTLLEYPVQFEGRATPANLTLVDGDGAPVPFQLANVKMRGGALESATVCFFSDLPGGATRTFVLKAGASPETPAPAVRETVEHDSIVLDAGVLKVRIPASRTAPAEAPGPVMQLSRGGGWIGGSRLYAGDAQVRRITASRVETGPLFITYRIVYDFAPTGRYTATVRALAGTEFVELSEQMDGIENARVETAWRGFQPQFRQAPNHPYDPAHDIGDPFEPIDFAQMNTHISVAPGIGKDGQLPFRLGPYQPWPAFVVGTFANFWNEKTGDALGVFSDKVGRWDDGDYAIWHSSDRLAVRFFWRDGLFYWEWPLATGTRSTCLSFYDHALDRKAVEDMTRRHAGVTGRDGKRYSTGLQPTSHMLFLQNRHGVLDLNEVKDWVLEYPVTARQPKISFREGNIRDAAGLERSVLGSGLLSELVSSGTRQNGGFGPVPSRQIEESWIDGFNRLGSQLNERQRARVTAALLLMAYTHAGEDYMPMRQMLSGHPNFLSDVKSVPALVAFLFPDHPMAKTWADLFRKYMELNTHYHTRPTVTAWDAEGGRWTENLGTYVWGFIRPAIRANYALELSDGVNRFPTPELAELGDYLVNALSAPFSGEPDEIARGPRDMHQWGMVTKENGPRRIHPPQGAHAERRMPPRSMWLLGKTLERFAPLTAEHLLWAARPEDQDQEQPLDRPDPWRVMFDQPDNRGTDPHLTSAKYTGYGTVLRAGAGTPDELSIHLQQIDDGPNYRWGNQPDSGTGIIYFYARGKAYSHNGKEDTGDRATQDTDLQTNFGAWKDGKFRSVGRNTLNRPLYNLDVAQFAELAAGPYSAPEYLSRSILLVGKDYFITFDDVFNEAIPHRFSWFVGKYEEMPFVQMLRQSRHNPETRTDLLNNDTKGVWYDGLGDSMAIVSHRQDLKVEQRPYGATVHVDGGVDQVFRDNAGVTYRGGDIVFEGKAGVVRKRPDGSSELALVHGSRIAAGGLTLETADADLGLGASFRKPAEVSGIYYAPHASSLRIAPAPGEIYVDGERQTVVRTSGGADIALKAGTHRWQMTAGDPVPNAPRILRTENNAGGARVIVERVAGASGYSCEISRDGGKTWSTAAATLSGLPDGVKVHVRAIALHGTQQSAPGPEYPVYVTVRPPTPPDGLSIQLRDGGASLSWGELLGVTEYRVYAGDRLVFRGRDRHFADAHAAHSYAVSAVNGNGEGPRSAAVQADSHSWLTFDPKPGEPFRRGAMEKPGHDPAPPYYPH